MFFTPESMVNWLKFCTNRMTLGAKLLPCVLCIIIHTYYSQRTSYNLLELYLGLFRVLHIKSSRLTEVQFPYNPSHTVNDLLSSYLSSVTKVRSKPRLQKSGWCISYTTSGLFLLKIQFSKTKKTTYENNGAENLTSSLVIVVTVEK
jgi:hypothetical protein